MSILDTIKIKIKLKEFTDNPLAIVTLNINDEVEVRFCPIFWKKGRSGLFFTMPSLRGNSHQNCFIVLDKEKYEALQSRVVSEFLVQAKEHYYPDEFKLIESAFNVEKENQIDPNDIPF